MEKQFKYLVFILNGRVLCKYSIKGTFLGELRATVELLAYVNGVETDQIEIKLEV